MSSLLFPELKGNIFRNFGPLRVSVGGQQHSVTVVQEGTLCTGLTVILLNCRGFRRAWRQQGNYVKSKLQKTASFIESSHCMFHQSTHIYIQPLT